jgi:hypothetical protein
MCIKLKSTIFWDITPCSLLKVNRRFGGTYRLHLQGRKISRARNQSESRWQATTLTLNGLHGVISQKMVLFITTAVRTSNPTNPLLPPAILRHWRWKRYVPPKRRLTFNGLHRVISQKMVLFITTAVRTSNAKNPLLPPAILRHWRWRQYVPPKRRLTLNGLHGVMSQKMVLFITTAVRTSNPKRV